MQTQRKNKIIFMIVVFALVVITALIAANNNSSKEADQQSSQSDQAKLNQEEDMTTVPDNLEQVVTKAIERQSLDNVYIVDVRTDQEWNEKHAQDAVHWGLVEHLEEGQMPPIEKDAEIYVYCRTGNRAGQAIKIMQENGYTNMTNIASLDDWIEAGGATSKGVDNDNQEED